MGVFERVKYGFRKSVHFLRTDINFFTLLVIVAAFASLVGLSVAFQPLVGIAAEGAANQTISCVLRGQ